MRHVVRLMFLQAVGNVVGIADGLCHGHWSRFHVLEVSPAIEWILVPRRLLLVSALCMG